MDGLDSLCGECITRLWNGAEIPTVEIKRNYEQRIHEIEISLLPDIGPERQAQKREMIGLREQLQHLLSPSMMKLQSNLQELMEDVKIRNVSFEELLEERREFSSDRI